LELSCRRRYLSVYGIEEARGRGSRLQRVREYELLDILSVIEAPNCPGNFANLKAALEAKGYTVWTDERGKSFAKPSLEKLRASPLASDAVAFPVRFSQGNSLSRMNDSFAPGNSDRLSGPGTIRLGQTSILITGTGQGLIPWEAALEVDREDIANVEQDGCAVRIERRNPRRETRSYTMWLESEVAARDLVGRLPPTRTADFAPVLHDEIEFDGVMRKATPRTPVTIAIVAAMLGIFLFVATTGAGSLKPDAKILVQWGANFTPATVNGQWWRLLTATALHASVPHVALNMVVLFWAGSECERLFGSIRFLAIYIFAGLAGSLASLLCRPLTLSVGASGAIFGLFGASIAFFLVASRGVPKSVTKAQLTSLGIFAAYTLLMGTVQPQTDCGRRAMVNGVYGGT
jgi:rhomboid protease GluP